MKPLHRINPVRMGYIREQIQHHNHQIDLHSNKPFTGMNILDIGCGGGLLCEPLTRLGANVTGIDPGSSNIEIAKSHAVRSKLIIDYQATTAEELVETGRQFDLVLAMEVIEHVANIPAFTKAASNLVRPGGLFIGSTINRTMRSFALAIVGAEYILRWLPKGTHSWDKFVTPQEFEQTLKHSGLDTYDKTGMMYSPFTDTWRQSPDTAVNYFIAANKSGGIC
jgi:2-polyprenyl-6-hydroxyphenyl methylase / 3-demethylubiquinone-9 3-methyltransferase